MAQNSIDKYIDVDRTVLEPSPQRVRNILTLEERVQAIKAYECRPMYTKVAKMFNCSWEQIKNIIANRDAIIEFYEATKNKQKQFDPDRDDIRKRKLIFLGECMYEYIQRAQFYRRANLTEDIIRTKALEFRDIIEIENFVPNKPWINHFKATYNISLSNRQITLIRTPPASLDLKDIMTYCTKNQSNVDFKIIEDPPKRTLYRTRTQVEAHSANQATLEEYRERRQRKIQFMEKALYEYIQRSQFHYKMPLNRDLLREIATRLRDMLKIDNFYPDNVWIKHFKSRFGFCLSQGSIVMDRTPPLSLDLRDILSFCSRNENKNQSLNTITLTPKDDIRTKTNYGTSNATKTSAEQGAKTHLPFVELKSESNDGSDSAEIINDVVEIIDDDDFKPNMAELPVVTGKMETSPPLKIRKIESLSKNIDQLVHSPGHWSEHSEEDEMPKNIRNYKDALKWIKPLEEFAMLEENYRVIGLVSQLEEIFKNPPKKEFEGDLTNET